MTIKAILTTLFLSITASQAFAGNANLVNQSSEDILAFYSICSSQYKPQESDCAPQQNILLPAGKITSVATPDAQPGYTVSLIVTHTQNLESYGNYSFARCDSNDSYSALFTVTDGRIFCQNGSGLKK